MEGLTERQQDILSFISAYIKRHNYPPTIREISEETGISVKGAYDHVNTLKRKKKIKMAEKSSRTIELINDEDSDNADDFVEIPLLGDVAAGKRIFSEENYSGTIRLHNSMLKKDRQYFALNVRGDSMTGIGVMDGDTVIIERKESANNGDVVVVDFDDGGRALKKFYLQSHRIKLQSENPKYPPMYSTNVRILGKLSLVYRNYGD